MLFSVMDIAASPACLRIARCVAFRPGPAGMEAALLRERGQCRKKREELLS
jgi:hypothetical protein